MQLDTYVEPTTSAIMAFTAREEAAYLIRQVSILSSLGKLFERAEYFLRLLASLRINIPDHENL